MKDYHHYVPLLRLKASELDALRDLKPETKARITPLIEVLPNNDEKKTFSKYIQARLTKLTDTCKDIPFYVDLALLHPTPADFDLTFKLLEDKFSSGELAYVPVVTLQTPKAVRDALFKSTRKGREIALRIKAPETEEVGFTKTISDMITATSADSTKIHLIVDCDLINNQAPDFKLLASRLPDPTAYARFIFLSGSFPKNLTGFKLGVSNHARSDWATWKQLFSSKPFKKIPLFGDYTIQHPLYAAPPKRSNVSASIRYTTDDYWLILRGESLSNPKGPKHKQYGAHAAFLIGRPEYCGSSFSTGDNHINAVAIERKTTGAVKHPGIPKTWLTVGFSHHMEFVINQLSKIP